MKILFAMVVAAVVGVRAALAADLAPVAYNNPGLIVDLGVGLWSAPIPCDADGDGDFDLIVVCHDKPYQGTYLFQNVSGDTATNKLPVFKAARRLGKGVENAMPSYVDGRLRVLTPGFEHPDFLKVGLDAGVKLPTAFSARTSAENTTKLPFKLRGSQWRYVDFDGDGRLDLVNGVGDWSQYGWDNAYDSGGHWTNGPLHGFVYWLRNTNSSASPAYAKAEMVHTTDGRPVDVFGTVSPSFADFDGDGDLDLLCGEFLDGFTYFENVGSRTQPRFAPGRRVKMADGNPVAMDLCMIVPVAFDWDKDGDYDLIVGDEDGRVAFVENTGKLDASHTPIFKAPVYFKQEADQLKSGALATPVAFDWDGDGDLDILSGNTAAYAAIGRAETPRSGRKSLPYHGRTEPFHPRTGRSEVGLYHVHHRRLGWRRPARHRPQFNPRRSGLAEECRLSDFPEPRRRPTGRGRMGLAAAEAGVGLVEAERQRAAYPVAHHAAGL